MEFLEWAAGTYIVAGIQAEGFISIITFFVAPWVYSSIQDSLISNIRWYLSREDKTFKHWSYWVFFPIAVPVLVAAGIAATISMLTLKPFLILLMKIIKWVKRCNKNVSRTNFSVERAVLKF